MISRNTPTILHLAPMEGVVDRNKRHLLSQVGGVDLCVTEFVRVNSAIYPERVFNRYCPELANRGCTTDSGVPVAIQLLGTDPAMMAANARKALELGANRIDMNFGCPSKTVNGSCGGAKMLQNPDSIFRVVEAVATEINGELPVTAKMRLGWDNFDNALQIGKGIEAAGASTLCIHARSKTQGYKPPAFWREVAPISDALDIEVVINGEIFSLDHFHAAREQSGCRQVMLGRGLLAQPDLGLQIKADIAGEPYTPYTWQQVVPLLQAFQTLEAGNCPIKFQGGRLKQWLVYLRDTYPEAKMLFNDIKRIKHIDDIWVELNNAA